MHPDDRPKVVERVMDILTHGKVAPLLEERLLRRDGSHVVVEIAALDTVFDGEPAVLALARDITERKKIEAQLVMNDRLASLGRLAASVGHELNNPLAYILGNVALMDRDLAQEAVVLPEPIAVRFGSYVKLIREGAVRMRDIVNDLKILARGDGKEAGPIDLSPLLDVCANMAAHELRGKTRLVKDYQDNVVVFGTAARLGQVFLNLLVNAAQAIPEGTSEDEVRIATYARGDEEVVIEISDTGTGVADTDIGKIFEPFFTTKDGVGTGLGLAIAHRIVTSAGGTITCEPRPGGGTVFRGVLPQTTVMSSAPPKS